jgi:2-oxoglutarate ferredoxin oxidoreductase subunit alpha
MAEKQKKVLIDGSRLIVEALVRAGADTFIGYPITPANLLFSYSAKRFPVAMAAPDEITTLQWMAGFATTGKVPVTATSFPGFALMVESINMAYMMELPMVIVLAQRLGPSTGTATVGAQGDTLMMNGAISGGYSLPTLCVSSLDDCWTLAAEAVKMAVEMRSPVVLLTAKEDAMMTRSFDLSRLDEIKKVAKPNYSGDGNYQSYKPQENLVPEFLPVANQEHQVRITASTHDQKGILQNSSAEALDNTRRLQLKLEKNLDDYTFMELDEEEGAKLIIVSYGITSQASRESVQHLRAAGRKVSLLLAKTLFPVPDRYMEIINKYEQIVFPEENFRGQYCQVLLGSGASDKLKKVNEIGRLISPEEIIQEVENVLDVH